MAKQVSSVDARRDHRAIAASARLLCRWPVAPLRLRPHERAEMVSQVLFGEQAQLLEDIRPQGNGARQRWLRLRLLHDGYEGYAPHAAFEPMAETIEEAGEPHVVSVPQTLLFPQADIRSTPARPLYMGSLLRVRRRQGAFLKLADDAGYIAARHARPAGAPPARDAATIAEMLLHAPYLWGGRTVAGIDCSGLVQLALRLAGHEHVPRDSGPQSRQVGQELPLAWLNEPGRLRRGDLVFWPGHVAMLTAPDTIIHANAHHMMVAHETLARAIARIEGSEGIRPLALRRP